MGIFFTADHHFGHENIIRYCERPFRDAAHMDAEMVRRWNEAVSHDDVVYHLGDFTLSGRKAAMNYLRRLDGMILILRYPRHHDHRWLPSESSRFWTRTSTVGFLPPLEVLTMKDYPPITLCHYPMARWNRSHYGAWHLHGHSHGKFQGEGKMMDIGVDTWNFAPVSLAEIAGVLEKL